MYNNLLILFSFVHLESNNFVNNNDNNNEDDDSETMIIFDNIIMITEEEYHRDNERWHQLHEQEYNPRELNNETDAIVLDNFHIDR